MSKDLNSDKIEQRAKLVLEEQARAILELSNSLPNGLTAASAMIAELAPEGRLICMGVGKAGHIAGKISATFASLGVASFFVHPSEAAHGDLGRLCMKDIVLCLSNSGQTLEILQIIPPIKQNGCKLITICANPDSDLCKNSEIVLDYGRIKESDPLGIAPTTSSTVMLALGDALVSCVLDSLGVTADQFAKNHPGGSIGKNLKPVADAMRKGESLCLVSADLSAKDVLHRMTATKGRPGCAVIIDSSGKLSGFFSDGDLRRCLEQNIEFLTAPISEVMSRNPKTIGPDMLVEHAIAVLTKYQIDQVVVSDEDGMPLGVLDIQDIISLS
jgi:arabinose-5-phosphate isomerase